MSFYFMFFQDHRFHFSPFRSKLILLHLVVEGVRNLLAPVQRADEYEEGAAGHDEAEGAGGCVAFVV